MKKETRQILGRLFLDNQGLEICRNEIVNAYEAILACYKKGGTLLVCGNGGSAADSEHIVGELMKGFLKKRPLSDKEKKVIGDEDLYNNLQGALPAISLVSQSAVMTAFINDVKPDMVYAQLVYGYRNPNNLLLGITTSGNSRNVINAIKIAKAFKMKTIGFTGQGGGSLSSLCDIMLKVPAIETYRVQELMLPVYHVLCAMVESEIFDEE
ncbi:MAG: SIS domain-containing protein [Clostridiales bacterium]|nr:SIS domain-containing protein [Clostridiales bacterium]